MKISALELSRTIKQALLMAADAGCIITALWLSVILVSPDYFSANPAGDFITYFLFCAISSVVIFYTSGLYRTVLLYMGLQSVLEILKGITLSTLVSTCAVYLTGALNFPGPAILVFWMMALLMIGGLRFAAKLALRSMMQNFRPREPVIIYGAGSSGMQLVAAIVNGDQYVPVAFIDDDESLIGNTVHGIRVHAPGSLRELIDTFSVRQILLAIPSATHAERKQILNNLEKLPVHVRTVPDLFDIVTG